MGMILPGQVYAAIGRRGAGKTLIATQLALRMADDLNYGVCFNFSINGSALYRYCLKCGYMNLCRKFREGLVMVRGLGEGIQSFMNEGQMIYIIDEASIWLDAHKWQNIPSQFLADLALMRHDRRRLFWITQDWERVAKPLRSMTDFVIEANGITKFDRELQNDKLLVKVYLMFPTAFYEQCLAKEKTWSIIKALFKKTWAAKYRFFQPVDAYDRLLFKVFDSFAKDIQSGEPVMDKPVTFSPIRGRRVTFNENEFRGGSSFVVRGGNRY
jgi:hypothetical protein